MDLRESAAHRELRAELRAYFAALLPPDVRRRAGEEGVGGGTFREIVKMLGQDGYEVAKAADGETALAMARAGRPELIFLDIVMPGMNGFAVLRALRREPETRGIPIVMISGNLQATEQFYVQRFGADDFMKKPFGRSEVFARIQHLTKTGRLVIRERSHDETPAHTDTELEHDAIPDIAMPDPHDLFR